MTTQTIVTFATDFTYIGDAVTINQTQQRVFDSTIAPDAVTYYNSLMNTIFSATATKSYDKNGNLIITPKTSLDVTDATAVQSALASLITWSKMLYVDSKGNQQGSGVYTIPGTSTLIGTMSNSMAQGLDSVVRFLGSFGFDANPGQIENTTASLINAWEKPHGIADTKSQSAFLNTVNSAIGAANTSKVQGGRSGLQEILITDYVEYGNKLLYDEMAQLQEAISINQTTLKYINSLQDLMNLKKPQDFALALNFLQSSGGIITQDSYDKFEEQSFNTSIGTQLATTDVLGFAQGNQGLLKDAFKILDPSKAAPTKPDGTPKYPDNPGYDFSAQGVADNIAYLYKYMDGKKTKIGDTSGALNNLLSSLNNVYANLTTQIKPGSNPPVTESGDLSKGQQGIITDVLDATLNTWILDYATTGSTQTGDFQRNLSNASAASQSFNDTERENLNRVMFIFQEFYQSASTLIANINDVINRITSMITKQ